MIINKKGFTLIELLIVIAIIAILASVIFVALDPLTRFRDSRDSARWQGVSALATAIKVDQVDNGGDYLTAIKNMSAGTVYMIVDGAMNAGCDDHDGDDGIDCDVGGDSSCVNLEDLVTEGYLGDVPVSLAGEVSWDDGSSDFDEGTGYTIEKESTGIIHVRACESENSIEIVISR